MGKLWKKRDKESEIVLHNKENVGVFFGCWGDGGLKTLQRILSGRVDRDLSGQKLRRTFQ